MKKSRFIILAIIAVFVVALYSYIVINKEELIFIYMLYDHIQYNGNDYYISEDQHAPSEKSEKRGPVYLVYKSSKINYENCNSAYVYTEYEGEDEEIYLFFDSAEYIRGDYRALKNNISDSDDLCLNSDTSQIKDCINIDTINQAKYILGSYVYLEEMIRDYGPIFEVEWVDGAIYKHEKLDLWVAYFCSRNSFLVSLEGKEPETVLVEVDGVQYEKLEYKKGEAYTILEEEKDAPILYLRYKFSDLFNEPDYSLTLEEFEPFAEIFYSELSESSLIRFLYDGLMLTITTNLNDMLERDCEVKITKQPEQPIGTIAELPESISSMSAIETSQPIVSDSDHWHIRRISSWGDDGDWRWIWTLADSKLWYLNNYGIHYFDFEADKKVTVTASVYNTVFFVDDCLWFTNNYFWEEYSYEQPPLARFDMTLGQYYEYPTTILTGVNTTVLQAYDKVIVCADNNLFQYDRKNDQLIKLMEYGEDIWRVAGNEDILAVYTGDSLKLYKTNGEFVEYNPTDCLPDTYVTEMYMIEDELLICWGGEGEPAGVACLNTQTGAWTHYIDIMNDDNFITAHKYTPISNYYGEIWIRGENTVYLPLKQFLFKFSLLQREFECVSSMEESIYDAIPFQNGNIIAKTNGVLFFNAENEAEELLENVKIYKLIEMNSDTFLVITEQGLFECKFVE